MFELGRQVGESFKKLIGKEKAPRVPDLYVDFLKGKLGPRELFASLPPSMIKEFIEYHQSHRAQAEQSQDRAVAFKLNQIDNMIERGLEKSVLEAHGVPVITKRESRDHK